MSASKHPVGIAVVGAGNISDEYLRNLTAFPDLVVHAIGDLAPERARAKADTYGIPRAGGIDVPLSDPDVEIVVNLTVPAAHTEVSTQILRAGKHVWTEKPMALDRAAARELMDLSAASGLRVGAAVDTFLGRGLQTARRLIDSGAIGRPLSAITMMQQPGAEAWHPNPEFFYAPGAGPLWDLGPYYLTMLTQLLGPMSSAIALATTATDRRTIHAGPQAGGTFPVKVPTSYSVLTEFESGQTAQSTYSFDSPLWRMGWVEITGTEATMAVPDPNVFDGDIFLYPSGHLSLEELFKTGGAAPERSTWKRVETGPWTATRGMGVLDLARSLRAGVPHRASAELGYHVVDALEAISESVASRALVPIESTVAPAPFLDDDYDPYEATL